MKQGMKLNTTLRPMTKFNPTKCQATYDPLGEKQQMSGVAAPISGSATFSAPNAPANLKPTVAPTTAVTTTQSVRQ